MAVKSVVAWGVGLSLLSSACTMQALKPAVPATPAPAFVRWSQSGSPDKRICVLPFADRTGTEGLAAYVRQSFAGHLSIKRFSDAELYEIDARLDTLTGDWRNQPAQRLGKTLQCDALVYGQVTTAKRLYLGLYSQLTLEGGIRVVDAATGQSLVAESYATKFRAGALPLSPFEIVPAAVMSLRNMNDTQLVRAIDDLGRHLADTVPDLPAPPLVSPVAQPLSLDRGTQVPGSASTPSVSPVTQPSAPPPIKTPPMRANAPPVPAHAESDRYQVQVTSFNTPGEAQQAARLLRDKGYRPTIAETTGTAQARLRMVVGPFPSIHEAQQVSAQIQKILRVTPIVVQTSVR